MSTAGLSEKNGAGWLKKNALGVVAQVIQIIAFIIALTLIYAGLVHKLEIHDREIDVLTRQNSELRTDMREMQRMMNQFQIQYAEIQKDLAHIIENQKKMLQR